MSHRSPLPAVFEPEYLEGFRQIFEEKIVFNQTLGLRLTHIEPGRVQARIDMRHELVGHFAYNRIHGGVISAALDAIGSAAVMAAAAAKHMDEAPAKRLERFAKLGTMICASITCAPALVSPTAHREAETAKAHRG